MRNKIWKQLSLATLLTIGIAGLWACIVGLGMAIFDQQNSKIAYQIFENLVVNEKNEVVIRSQDHANYNEETFRSLDSKPANPPVKNSHWKNFTRLNVPQPAQLGEIASDWNSRVNQVAQSQQDHIAKTIWYLVHNGEDVTGKAYLIGYSNKTNLVMGYYGQAGFSHELPPADQWFGIDGRVTGNRRGSLINISGFIAYGDNNFSFNPNPDIDAPNALFIASKEGLFEIDLNTQTVKNRDDQAAYRSVLEARIAFTARNPSNPLVDNDNSEQSSSLESKSKKQPQKILLACVVGRQMDKIIASPYDEDNDYIVPTQPIEFMIPTELRELNFNICIVSPELAIIDVPQSVMHAHSSKLYWINKAGEIQKNETVVLNPGRAASGKTTFIAFCLLLPMLAVVLFIFAIIAPNDFSLTLQAESYLERLGLVFAEAWPALLILTLVSGAFAWWVLKRHQKLALPNATAWGLFVLLLGFPAAIIYFIQHSQVVLEKCPACGKMAPRDRAACSHCQQAFAEPSLTGTEIFV